RWASLTSRSVHTWLRRACQATPWPRRNNGRPASRVRRTRWTTRRPSRWWMAPSRSCQKDTGSTFPYSCRRRPRVSEPVPRSGRRTYLADVEPEDGDSSRPRAADRFQVYPREARGGEPDAVAEQHGQDVYQDLVDEPALQALAGHVSAKVACQPGGAF